VKESDSGCNFVGGIVTCFGEKGDGGVEQHNFVNVSFCLSRFFTEE
jgi:hypothetical protein